MVLNRRIADSGLLTSRPRFKIKQALMEPVSGGVASSGRSKNRNGEERWNLVGSNSPGTRVVTNAANAAPTVVVVVVGNRSGGKISGMTVPVTSAQQPTTHQKVRRILEEHAIWRERANNNHQLTITRPPAPSSLSSNAAAPLRRNYNIVASRGESSRGSFSVRSTLGAGNTARNGPTDSAESGGNEIFVNGREDSRTERSNWEKRAASRHNEGSGWRNSEQIAQTLPKSSSVPANLKSVSESGPGTNFGRFGGKNSGILGKSSAFLASLRHSKNCNDRNKSGAVENDPKARGLAVLRRNCSSPFVTSSRGGREELRRSPSCHNLSNPGRNKNNVSRVKKSVSFSSDTSFEEKRGAFGIKTAVHEAKVYRKGVLRDFSATEEAKKKVSSEVPTFGDLEDPDALLRASREADDRLVRDLVSIIRRSGLGRMDVNATDSSGRTAISYMVGNGSTAMLEAALSFTGSDPNLPDNEGNAPLHFAAQAGQTECLNILLQRCPGIQVDARNILGFTPLMKAALQGRTKCAKILLFAGANPTMRDHGRGLRAEQWARYCGRHVCADVIERFARHRLLEKNISCRWGSEPELATKVLQGKVIPAHPLPAPSTGFRSRIKRVFRTSSGPERSFSLVSQLTNAALCASTPVLPKPGQVSPTVKSLVRPLSVPQLRVTLVGSQEFIERTTDKYGFTEKIESSIAKPPRSKKKSK